MFAAPSVAKGFFTKSATARGRRQIKQLVDDSLQKIATRNRKTDRAIDLLRLGFVIVGLLRLAG